MKRILSFIGLGIILNTLMVLMARSSILGFTQSTLDQATNNEKTGLLALMNMMQDYKSILYVGIPVGIILYLFDRFVIRGNKNKKEA
jgi:hypothetical protein